MTATLRPLAEEDVPQLLMLRRLAFNRAEDAASPDVRRSMRMRLPHTRGAFVDGRLVAAATWYPFEAWIGGARMPTGGLASVVSAPEARRRGHVRRLLASGFAELHEQGVGWSLEHPFDPRFYGRVGYRSVPNGALVELPIQRLPEGRPGDADAELLGPDAVERLRDMHETFARRWTFAIARTWKPWPGEPSPLWTEQFEAEGDGPPAFAYRVEGGYLIGSLEERGFETVLDLRDMAWRDGPARRRLWALVTGFRGQADRVRVHLPPGDALLENWRPWHTVPGRILQARIVELPAALAPLRPARGMPREPVVVRVRDAACAWNDGAWGIEPTDAGTRVTPADGREAAELDVAELVSLLAGTPPEVLLAEGRAEGDVAALRTIAGLTAAHPPFLARADAF